MNDSIISVKIDIEERPDIDVSIPESLDKVRVLIRAQACKESSCLVPSDFMIPLAL